MRKFYYRSLVIVVLILGIILAILPSDVKIGDLPKEDITSKISANATTETYDHLHAHSASTFSINN